MDYRRCRFEFSPMSEDYCDVLASMLGGIGFDSFEGDDDGLWGYVQTSLYDEGTVKELLSSFPFEGVKVDFRSEEMPREDWNAEWEKSFEPISVGDLVYIHDDRHEKSQTALYDILICPRMAFGSGSHATTRMMLRLLLEHGALYGKRVLDVGCGTGILGIGALKGGCSHLTAIDIDNDSVENTKENLALNEFEGQEVLEGDISVVPSAALYDIVLANIHLNIHLALMGDYVKHLKSGGMLFLSGFYTQEAEALEKAAARYGLKLKEEATEDGWEAMYFEL